MIAQIATPEIVSIGAIAFALVALLGVLVRHVIAQSGSLLERMAQRENFIQQMIDRLESLDHRLDEHTRQAEKISNALEEVRIGLARWNGRR